MTHFSCNGEGARSHPGFAHRASALYGSAAIFNHLTFMRDGAQTMVGTSPPKGRNGSRAVARTKDISWGGEIGARVHHRPGELVPHA